MKFDLRDGHALPIGFLMELEHAAKTTRQQFVTMIEALSERHSKNLDWWVSKPASRDILLSALFYKCCLLEALQSFQKDDAQSLEQVITDSPAFGTILKKVVPSDTSVVVYGRHYTLLDKMKLFKKAALGVLSPYIYSFGTKAGGVIKTQHPILIDTFIVSEEVESDRYYTGLLDHLNEEEARSIYFVPTFTGIPRKMYKNVFAQIKRCHSRNFLLKESILTIWDYLFAFCFLWRRKRIKLPEISFNSIDITTLIQEELVSWDDLGSNFTALLNYRFAYRLKKAGITPRLVIDWFENQVIDKGWNIGFAKYFPSCPRLGYQGMLVSDHWLHKFPTKEEQLANALPNRIAVPSRKLVDQLKEFNSDIETVTAPGFRFKGVFSERAMFPDSEVFTILVALPISLLQSRNILRSISRCCHETFHRPLRFVIKRHPLIPESDVRRAYCGAWPSQFEFVVGDFNQWIEKSNLLVSSTSSVCIESLAKGVPVIVSGNHFGLTYNPIPESMPKEFWSLCFSDNQYIAAINYFIEASLDREYLSKKVLADYFTPITREAVCKFLDL